MSEKNLSEFLKPYEDEIERLLLDVNHGYSFSKVTYIYGRLKKMGPWKPSDFTMEMFLEIDMMHAALAITYGRIFSDGARKLSRDKVPSQLRPIHDQIIELRNQRYAHNDEHESIELQASFELDGENVIMRSHLNMEMVLGAPAEWQELFDWLGGYLFEQSRKQLARLTELSGKQWSQPEGPPPSWIEK